MENSPLTLAHTHARNAVSETQKSNPIAASEEHDLAAAEFASAAKETGDPEALRILKLLEAHHARLAEILKAKPDTLPTSPTTANLHVQDANTEAAQEPAPKQPDSNIPQVPTLNREGSSSIASNLASARGIPSIRNKRGSQAPTQISAQNAEGRLTKPVRKEDGSHSKSDIRDKARLGQTSAESRGMKRSSHLTLPETSTAPPPPITTAGSEDAFARFYSAFNSIRNTISAPLAFAGLPLNSPPESPQLPTSPERSNSKRSSRSDQPNPSPDINRIFSRAAIRAIRDEHGNPPSDSFYVVPTSGGTITYANMLQHAKHARQSSNLTDSAEEFVDAQEMPQPASPTRSRRGDGGGHGGSLKSIGGIELDPKRRVPPRPGQTYEELHVENGMLKAVAVDLADRLRAFELGAQKSSLALHASMRQFSSPTASAHISGLPGSGKSGVPPVPGEHAAVRALDEKVRELEEQVRGLTKENRRLGRENEKLMGVVKRYREKWEALKEGARERIKGGSSTNKEESIA